LSCGCLAYNQTLLLVVFQTDDEEEQKLQQEEGHEHDSLFQDMTQHRKVLH